MWVVKICCHRSVDGVSSCSRKNAQLIFLLPIGWKCLQQDMYWLEAASLWNNVSLSKLPGSLSLALISQVCLEYYCHFPCDCIALYGMCRNLHGYKSVNFISQIILQYKLVTQYLFLNMQLGCWCDHNKS